MQIWEPAMFVGEKIVKKYFVLGDKHIKENWLMQPINAKKRIEAKKEWIDWNGVYKC